MITNISIIQLASWLTIAVLGSSPQVNAFL